MRGDRAKAGMLATIASSVHSITVKYPPKRVAAAGTPPALVPMAPLTGPVSAPTVIPGAPATPEKADKVLRCLWYDAPTGEALNSSSNHRIYRAVGWRQGALALACVALADAALDPTKLYGLTAFDGCMAVEHAGTQYSVLGLTRAAAAFNSAYVGYIWLSGTIG